MSDNRTLVINSEQGGGVVRVVPSHYPIVSAVQAGANWLGDLVINGELVAGQQVTEADVVTQFGVSRPTAKNAITVLVNNGLLRREANRSAYVPQLSVEDIEDLYLVRVPLELDVVRRVASSRQVPPGCASVIEDVTKIGAETPPGEFVETDLRFHRLLVESVASPRLSRLYQSILGETHLSMVQSKRCHNPQSIAQEHGDVLLAIEEGDEAKAVELMRRHLESTRERTAAGIAGRR